MCLLLLFTVGRMGRGDKKAYDPLLNDGYGSGEIGRSLSPPTHLISLEIRVGDDRFMCVLQTKTKVTLLEN